MVSTELVLPNNYERFVSKAPEKVYKDYDSSVEDPFQDPKKSKWLGIPWCVYILSVIQVAIFIYEIVEMKQLTGSVIQTEPYINPMIGPSTYVQIYLGSRFQPCMHSISGITDDDSLEWPCPNSTTTDTDVCTLQELCNYKTQVPNQMFRIISAIFLHAGFVHLFFNLLLQLTTGREVEKLVGSIRFLITYLLSGLSGNIFGMNFAGDGISSVGASGALFGIIAMNLMIYVLHKDRNMRNYKWIITALVVEIFICLVLGLLPGLDNFAHIGGFICGLLLSIIILNNPNFVHLDLIDESNKFIRNYDRSNIHFNRLIWWSLIRILSLILLAAWFIGLALNFIKNGGNNCSWCKYLSCIPVNDWCDSDISTTSS